MNALYLRCIIAAVMARVSSARQTRLDTTKRSLRSLLQAIAMMAVAMSSANSTAASPSKDLPILRCTPAQQKVFVSYNWQRKSASGFGNSFLCASKGGYQTEAGMNDIRHRIEGQTGGEILIQNIIPMTE